MGAIDALLSINPDQLIPQAVTVPLTISKLSAVESLAEEDRTLEAEVRPISTARACELTDRLTMGAMTGKTYGPYDMSVDAIVECVPLFRRKDLLDHFTCVSARDLVFKLLTAKEIDYLYDTINTISGTAFADAAAAADPDAVDQELKNV